MRLADVYLMFAEVENEINKGPTPDAYEYLNKVKRRAFGLPINQTSEIDYNNLDYSRFLDEIYKERRLELAFEGHRWFDLIRRPERAVQVLQAHGKSNVSVDRLLLPIPQYVIEETDGVITQNPGYN
jgi:starch-binding outer membrane protein, SusD/RagB family